MKSSDLISTLFLKCTLVSGMLKWKFIFKPSYLRWTPAAEDIVFTSPFLTFFFTLGRVIPLCRGDGVFQKTMDFCVEQLNKGSWIHMFPEGTVQTIFNLLSTLQ